MYSAEFSSGSGPPERQQLPLYGIPLDRWFAVIALALPDQIIDEFESLTLAQHDRLQIMVDELLADCPGGATTYDPTVKQWADGAKIAWKMTEGIPQVLGVLIPA